MYLDSSNGLAFVEWINKRIGVQVKEFCFLYDDAYAAFFNINQLDKAIQFAEEGDIPHANSRVSSYVISYNTTLMFSRRYLFVSV